MNIIENLQNIDIASFYVWFPFIVWIISARQFFTYLIKVLRPYKAFDGTNEVITKANDTSHYVLSFIAVVIAFVIFAYCGVYLFALIFRPQGLLNWYSGNMESFDLWLQQLLGYDAETNTINFTR
jgi:hypothetical protein